MMSIGEQLKEARMLQKWTIETAARTTKIRADQIADLEQDDFSGFASPAYARGFVRIYARALGLNEVKITRQLDAVMGEGHEEAFVTAPPIEYIPKKVSSLGEGPVQKFGWVIWIGLGGLFLIVFILSLSQMRRKADTKPAGTMPVIVVAKPSPAPVGPDIPTAKPLPVAPVAAIPSPVPKPAPVPEEKLVLTASEDTWVRVVKLDGSSEGNEVFSDVMAAGDRKEFTGAKFTIKMMIPAALQVSFGDKEYGTLSPDRLPKEFAIPETKQ